MKNTGIVLLFFGIASLQAQVFEFTSDRMGTPTHHRILMDKEYIIETVYQIDPAVFITTRGGYYKKDGNRIQSDLEFNSNFENDALKTAQWDSSQWIQKKSQEQVLDGKWLMAGRVKTEGEQRRDINRSRKTQKFLIDGHFQWTAFNTETFQFFGSGGGTYTAHAGAYVEQIDYFSRDNSRAGAALSFEYDLRGKDWYHKGRSSKGQPLHEIWTQRPPQ